MEVVPSDGANGDIETLVSGEVVIPGSVRFIINGALGKAGCRLQAKSSGEGRFVGVSNRWVKAVAVQFMDIVKVGVERPRLFPRKPGK